MVANSVLPDASEELCEAVLESGRHLSKLKSLLARGLDPNQPNQNGDTPLHVAAWSGKSQVASCLLSFGADPDVPNLGGFTPLHLAVWRGHLPMVSTLLQHD